MNKSFITLFASFSLTLPFANALEREIFDGYETKDKTISKIENLNSDQWMRIGSGALTDFVVSSIYSSRPNTISVDFEQNVDDPTTYRIIAPYDNWRDRRADGLIWYDETKATPLVFHVIDGKYAWLEDFNTGLYIDTSDDYGPIVGEITVVPQVQALIARYGIEYVIKNIPTALCTFDEGTLKLDANYMLGASSNPNIRIDVGGEPMFRGNKDGAFCIQLPSAPDLSPDMKWKTLEGKARFTDGFTSLFAYLDVPLYPTYEVTVQQNEGDTTIYRLVNPFASFEDKYSSYEIVHDDSKDYYMTIYTFPKYNVACTNTFRTGLLVNGEMFGVQNMAYYFYDTYASTFGWYLSEVAEEFSYMFGDFKDGVLTYPGYYEDEYSGQIMEFPNFTGWTGTYKEADDKEQFYVTNKLGYFKVVLPNANVEDSADEIILNDDSKPEFYNLQGIRLTNPQPGTIVIERRGNDVSKRIFR